MKRKTDPMTRSLTLLFVWIYLIGTTAGGFLMVAGVVWGEVVFWFGIGAVPYALMILITGRVLDGVWWS